jgi:hypothetical protein
MKKLLVGMLLLAGVIAVVAVMRRRSGSDVDDWDTFAPADTYSRASVSKAADDAKESVSKAADAAQKSAAKAAEAAKDV